MLRKHQCASNFVLHSIPDHFGISVCLGDYLCSGLRRIYQKKQPPAETEGLYQMRIKLKKIINGEESERCSKCSRKLLGVATQKQPKNWWSLISTGEDARDVMKAAEFGDSNLMLNKLRR